MHRHSILITGAAGTIGSILGPALSDHENVTGLDLPGVDGGSAGRGLVRGDVGDRDLIEGLLQSSDVVVHLATGAPRGWEGLLDVDIRATRQLLDLAALAGIRRVIFASTNHVAGGFELDYFRRGLSSGERGSDAAVVEPTDPIRPDSAYGAAKAFGEAYGRFTAETTDTAVSCLRIGTVAPIDDPDAYATSPEFAHIPGGVRGVSRRLRATWLSHPDLIRLLREELSADDRFRLRFGVSDNPDRFWSLETYGWNPR
jgi:nucleoside-diphosphate-sugar epimerase